MIGLWIAACTSEPPASDPFDPQLAAALTEALHTARLDAGAPGAVAAVLADGGWVGASGVAQVDPPVPTMGSDRFRIGSITKVYVAATLLWLADEGRIDLDAPADTIVAAAPHGHR